MRSRSWSWISKELRELRNDYLLAPDKIEIIREMLSEYPLNIFDLYNITINNIKNLVPNVFDKKKYVIQYENLNFYLGLGLKLKEIHPLLEFNKSQWLKPHIEFNTQKEKSRKK